MYWFFVGSGVVMSRVLQQCSLAHHQRKHLLKHFVHQCHRREISAGSRINPSHGWKFAVASCAVGSLAGGSLIWWKWNDLKKEQCKRFKDGKSRSDNTRAIKKTTPLELSGSEFILQKCSHDAEVEHLSTAPWL